MRIVFRAFSGLLFAVLAACQALPAADVQTTLSDAEACGVGILATSQGTPDLADLLRCGMTVADVWNLVTKLEKQNDSDAGNAALSPASIAWRAKLQGVKTQITARDAGVK